MSFLLLIILIVIGKIMISVLSSYEYDQNNVSIVTSYVLAVYIALLFVSAMVCFAIGVFWWFQDGIWLTVSPQLMISWLDDSSFVKFTLLADTSWSGLQWMNHWYLAHNIGWSFLFTVIVLYVALQFEIENNRDHDEQMILPLE